MPLVVDQLQLWTIAFKWAGLDANRLWLRIPTPVRDNFSTLLEAILSEHLECSTLASEKYTGDDPQIAPFYIRHWIDDIYDAVHGQSYNRKLMKHVVIERWAFRDWCERRSIPLPEFWFPPGWTDYRWPEEDFEPIPTGPVAVANDPKPTDAPEPLSVERASPSPTEVEKSSSKELRPVQLAKFVCKQIASVIWRDNPTKTIADMSKDDLILRYGGGQYYSEEVVRRWVKEVAPPDVSAKKGRPKKQNSTEDE